MTQEERQLLFIDLSSRLPYKVLVKCKVEDGEFDNWLDCINLMDLADKTDGFEVRDITFTPYLRPMSSMTEEEKKIMRSCGFELIPYDTGRTGFANIENCIDEVSFRFMEEFLNAHHFDYRGLIEKGLAIEATEGMYNFE